MLYTVENTVDAGRPVRVYVDGNEVEMVLSADTDKGVVVCLSDPMRLKKNSDEFCTRELRGKVTVVHVEM